MFAPKLLQIDGMMMAIGRSPVSVSHIEPRSQAVLFKVNTLGEEAFLDTIREVVRQLERD